MVLPAAAADRLRDVLSFEIDRQTPFAATDVAFDARVLRRRPDGQLDVDLVVVAVPPRALSSVVREALDTYPRAAVTDVGSVKGRILEELRAAGTDLTAERRATSTA